jgi:antitoxin HicB
VRSMDLCYPAVFHAEKEGGFSVSFPDFPEAHTQGDTKQEAFEMAIDCLHTAIQWRLEEKEEIPAASSKRRHQIAIPVPYDLAPKLGLLRIMREQRVSNVALARKLHVQEGVVRRMLNPKHKSKPEQYMRALHALGATPHVSLWRKGAAQKQRRSETYASHE